VVELAERGCKEVHGADLTRQAVLLAESRAKAYGVAAQFHVQNAEAMTFPDETFTHVNCQGVIHHTPRTEECMKEIARVLKPDGTALVSVYYRNFFLRNWRYLRWLGKGLFLFGAKMKGRGRERIFSETEPDSLVRLYDGDANPVGKAYSLEQMRAMAEPYFEIEKVFYHFFPARSLPVRVPGWLHRKLDRGVPFMIYLRLRKKAAK
jgi:SAM-dependent methyltransferase